MEIGSIVIACHEFEKMVTFWQEALHYIPREPAKDGWIVLCDPNGTKPNISLNRVPGNAQAGIDCILTSTLTTKMLRWSDYSRLVQIGISGDISKMMILSY